MAERIIQIQVQIQFGRERFNVFVHLISEVVIITASVNQCEQHGVHHVRIIAEVFLSGFAAMIHITFQSLYRGYGCVEVSF